MCGEHAASSSTAPGQRWGWSEQDTPPDWETITLPPDHILKHRNDLPALSSVVNLTKSDRRTLSSYRPRYLYR